MNCTAFWDNGLVKWRDKVGRFPPRRFLFCVVAASSVFMWLHPSVFILCCLTYADSVGIRLRGVVELVEKIHVHFYWGLITISVELHCYMGILDVLF